MNLNDYKIFINGQPVKRSNSTDDLFPDTRSKNQKKKDRKEYYRQKRKRDKGADKMTEEIKQKFNEWLEENGGKEGALYQTFPDEELEKFFLTAYEKNKK